MVEEEQKQHKPDFYKEIVPFYIGVPISPKSLNYLCCLTLLLVFNTNASAFMVHVRYNRYLTSPPT